MPDQATATVLVTLRMWQLGPVIVVRVTDPPLARSVTVWWVGWRGGAALRKARRQPDDEAET